MLLIVVAAALVATPTEAADKLEYNRDIRPILVENCFSCHGPDSASRKAKLRLDQHDAAVKAGAIAPGKPQDSELVQRIFAEDVKERMPPAATKKVLTQAQKETLKRWIAAGAEYQTHWSFLPPCARRCQRCITRPGCATRSIVSSWRNWRRMV